MSTADSLDASCFILRHKLLGLKSFFPYKGLLDTPSEASQQEKFFKGGRGEDECPGRDKWRSWIAKQWDKWEIHPIVIRCLQEADVHPISIMVAGESLEWPNSTFCLPSATPELARALFGPEAFDSKGVLPAKFRQHLVSIGQHSWDKLRRRINNQKDRIHLLEESAMAAFTGGDGVPIFR
ncbi:hypothetical protein K435DRAFT_871318 [Dendrothele bispora CBS 962.96]|uniref:Uncharacterized protein n=1 Tax=Dendrothele bispora (strain CBS 962.96) TaxID=1314807 RepID=A0A4S8L4C6_DENBC|nr:hypothetical protein K435DRAFT_871318 [Dendrothele bispora CBS 962.96]